MKLGWLAAVVALALLSGCGGRVIAPVWAPKSMGALDPLDYYPPVAMRQRVPGHVLLHCTVDEGLHFTQCVVAKELPSGWGFGAAALRMIEGVSVSSPKAAPGKLLGVPVRFCLPGECDFDPASLAPLNIPTKDTPYRPRPEPQKTNPLARPAAG